MRVDVSVEFYVAVQDTEEGVSRAAQTLGNRTFQADQLRDIIEGKLIDALRSIAAQMTMDQLHENRVQFVRDVRAQVAEDLAKNGLELDSVSLTSLDQTPFEALDENNAFNAVGMRKLAEVIAKSKKERAQIDADAEVAVRLSSMEATRRKLEIEKDEEQARISQQQEIETLRAAQVAEIARHRAESERASEQARIIKEREIRAAEIERERAIREAEIIKDRELQAAEITKERELELANQERQIAIAQKSEEESQARAAADSARSRAAEATESITTTRRVAEAERVKRVALIEAQQKAETEAMRMRLLAAAEKEAAADHASARREAAQGEADAISMRAEAKRKDLLAQAEGQRAIVETDNALGERAKDLKVELARLEALPKIVAEMVRPAEKIESIRIHHISGFGKDQFAGSGFNGSEKPVVNQALDSILAMAVQLPALKKLGEELGFSMDSGLSEVLGKTTGKTKPETDTSEATQSSDD
jgi:uncharacterized membrane protein YqiK